MTLSEALLPEFDQEMATTRKFLARVPENQLAWKPHEKSGTMGWLAGHLARLPDWAVITIRDTGWDMAPDGVPNEPPPLPKSSQEALEWFDGNVRAAREAIQGASDLDLAGPWSLLYNRRVMFTMPRSVCLRTWVMNHVVHHRAQLGIYLRLNNVPVPATYGPSADEAE
jgi:uncharacterized damage-inducible protein DinB